MEIAVHRLADLGRVMFPIWTVVADVDALGLQLHALGTFALRCVRVIFAFHFHACDRFVIEDKLDRLRRHMANPFVPHIHRGADGDEISVAVIAGVVPVWI